MSKKNNVPMIKTNGDILSSSRINLPSIDKSFPMELPSTNLLQQLNPLEHISNTINRICYYKEQCKMLEVESLRIKEQANLMHSKIDSEFKKAMYELETRRKNNESKLIASANEFKQISIVKSELVKNISSLVSSICSKDVSLEDKKIMNESLIIMKGLLSGQRSESYEKFEKLLDSVDNSYKDVLFIENYQENYV
ncbi:hypothetical protein [Proteus columbae]|uniref:hypothetical protein n=1 Tax=Proteus columbae TaxID=1987580 RepID=UPI0034D73D37